jgi:hypothetical protein
MITTNSNLVSNNNDKTKNSFSYLDLPGQISKQNINRNDSNGNLLNPNVDRRR